MQSGLTISGIRVLFRILQFKVAFRCSLGLSRWTLGSLGIVGSLLELSDSSSISSSSTSISDESSSGATRPVPTAAGGGFVGELLPALRSALLI